MVMMVRVVLVMMMVMIMLMMFRVVVMMVMVVMRVVMMMVVMMMMMDKVAYVYSPPTESHFSATRSLGTKLIKHTLFCAGAPTGGRTCVHYILHFPEYGP